MIIKFVEWIISYDLDSLHRTTKLCPILAPWYLVTLWTSTTLWNLQVLFYTPWVCFSWWMDLSTFMQFHTRLCLSSWVSGQIGGDLWGLDGKPVGDLPSLGFF